MTTRKPARPLPNLSKPFTLRFDPTVDRFSIEVDVTVPMARDWFERIAPENRKERLRKTRQYRRDMIANDWLPTGDCIKIAPASEGGEVWDGGQRLRSFLQAVEDDPTLTHFTTFVAFNVSKRGMTVTDRNAVRTFAEAVRMEGGVDPNVNGAIVRRVAVCRQGNFADVRYGFKSGGPNPPFIDPSTTELLKLFKKNIHRFDAATRVAGDLYSPNHIGGRTPAGAAYFLLTEIDEQEAKAFFEHLVTGADLGVKDPVKVLRDRLMRAGNPKIAADELNTTEQLYFYFRAWNARRKDEPMDRLILPRRDPKTNVAITNANFIRPV